MPPAISNDRRPYLSVVVTARNDDHGGNLLRRMQIFVDGFIAQSLRHNVPTELLLVEWNPPANRPPLADALEWPRQLGPASVRVITVSREIHRRYRFADVLPLYQMIAKNVGVRRARGEFILATNIDILFSDELFRFFAQRRLEPNKMYRVDRYDAMSDVPLGASVEDQLEYCRTHLLRINAREGSYRVEPDGSRLIEENDVTGDSAGIALGVGWGAIQRQESGAYRLAEAKTSIALLPANSAADLWLRIEPGPALKGEAFELRASFDDAPLGRVFVGGRGWLRVPVSIESGRSRMLQLQAVTDKTFENPRAEIYRLWACCWDTPPAPSAALRPAEQAPSAPPAETTEARSERDEPVPPPRLELGEGWYNLEVAGRERFQWARSGAEWFVGPSSIPEWSLRAEMAPGPGVGYSAIHLRIRDESDKVVSTAVIEGRRVVRLSLTAAPTRTKRFRLFAAYGEDPVPVPGESRELHFCLFRRDWVSQPGPGPALPALVPAEPPPDSARDNPPAGPPARPDKFYELTPAADAEDPPRRRTRPPVHTNGCGDFTLLARRHWFDLRGYPEFDLFSMHLDSVLCMAAHHGGAPEEFLEPPACIYHIEHAIGSGFTPEGNQKLFDRLALAGIESLDWQQVFEWERQMQRLDAPMIFNRRRWGMAGVELPEVQIGSRRDEQDGVREGRADSMSPRRTERNS